MRTRILVIDDEESLCEILKFILTKEGYEVDTANSAEEALGLNLAAYDLAIADIMMEKMSGYDLVRHVRNNAATEHLPVILCSALSGEDDTVMGLNIGADDYITKPFKNSEVIARVRAVLRRSTHHPSEAPAMQPPSYVTPAPQPVSEPRPQQPAEASQQAQNGIEPDEVFKTMRLNLNRRLFTIDNTPIKLTPTEMKLMEFFLTRRNRIYSRDEIMEAVWHTQVSVRAIDTAMSRLRDKLGRYKDHIQTSQGFGYGFMEME